MSQILIKTEDLVKNYTVGSLVVHALRGVSVEVQHGEFVAVMGPSQNIASNTDALSSDSFLPRGASLPSVPVALIPFFPLRLAARLSIAIGASRGGK